VVNLPAIFLLYIALRMNLGRPGHVLNVILITSLTAGAFTIG
jgi:hypothetical protein